jgi:lysophospholipase L1-like esterase
VYQHQKHGKRPFVLAILAALVAQLFTGIGLAPQASASVTWPLEVDDIYPRAVRTHDDGSITLAECYGAYQSYTDNTVRTYNSTGDATTIVPKSASSTEWRTDGCDDHGVAGNDGTLYAMRQKFNAQSYTETEVVAIKNGVVLWSTSLEICPSYTKDGQPKWMTLGHDGDVYAVMSQNCTDPDKLVGFDSSDGSIKFQTSLSNKAWAGTWWRPRLGVYDDGLVLVDGNTLRYFNYDGSTSGVPNDYTYSLAGNEYFDTTAINSDGRVYVAVFESGQSGCDAKVQRVDWHDPDGSSGSVNVASYCMSIGQLRAMPGGDFLLQVSGSNILKLYRFSDTGTLVYLKNIGSMSGYKWAWSSWPFVDADGDVVVARYATETSGDFDRHVFVEHIGPTGTVTRAFDTTQFDVGGTQELFIYTAGDNFGLADGVMYLPLCNSTCSTTNPVEVHKISITGLTMDYPRNTILGALTDELSYEALGDSFSSGHGVSPFVYNTGAQGNECYRSEKAYPVLLDQNASVSLDLKAFVACSGAETQHIVDTTFKGEDPQVEAIGAGVDVVTVTIGGNDVDFADYGLSCLSILNCASGSNAYDTIMDKIENDLPSKLDDAYETIADKLDGVGAYSAVVLVIGYPFVIREHTVSQCYYADVTQAEQQAAEEVAIALNDEIAAAVIRMGQGGDQRFHHVDALLSTSPFDGHDLCSLTDRYFNLLDAHPNEEGQAAYATLIEDYLQAIS